MESAATVERTSCTHPEAPSAYYNDAGAPIRSAPFSLEHLEEYARALAGEHSIVERHRNERRLWREFESNGKKLVAAYDTLVAAVRDGDEITPGSDWLLDNFYVVRDQLREVREDLPPRFYRELPKLEQGIVAGYPRVYVLAVEMIAHTDSALDAQTITHFIRSYQAVSVLNMGELWAVPIMLRLALIDNLRRLADRIIETHHHARRADSWADQVIADRPADQHAFLNQCSQTHALVPPLVARIVQRFRDQGHDLAESWQWLEQRLAGEGYSVDDVLRNEHQRQACDQVSTGNVITSMLLLSAIDWGGFFEQVSVVEQELRRDPAQVYPRMDFATRDKYRHVVEKLARQSEWSESQVAERVVAEAGRCAADPVRGHVGYYLIDEGLTELAGQLAHHPIWVQTIRQIATRYSVWMYLTPIVLVWSAGLAALLMAAAASGASTGMLAVVAALCAIPVSEVSVAVVNYAATRLIRPYSIPRMDFRNGIPDDCRTMIVIPALLINEQNVHGLIERLELHYLANTSPQFSFALLADLKDAPELALPDDGKLLALAQAGIDALNARYAANEPKKFWLFHRARQWNESENQWMGWERKRGKLSEFNRVLRGATDTSYVGVEKLPAELIGIRYVITLDADTQLPLGTARALVSAVAHPLNRPRFDANNTRVEHGYAVLQPRIGFNPVAALKSRFAFIYSGNPRIDPYVTAVSDVYQDSFAEGSYTGKGIYDVDAFEQTVGSAFPDNRILSHDLIESCHARTALVTEIELIDDFPIHYHAYARRQHRWVRGDWQLLPWLLPRVPTKKGIAANRLSIVSRWKIIDNLRRSLVPPSVLALLVAGWTFLPGSPWLWSAVALTVLALPMLMQLMTLFLHWPHEGLWRFYLREAGKQLAISFEQVVCILAFLPHQSYLMVDAIVRTLTRLFITRRHLLEWETAYVTEQRLGRGWRFFVREIWTAPLIGLLAASPILAWGDMSDWWLALPIVALWIGSPWLAWSISQPVQKQAIPLNEAERCELRLIACRTWLFFRRFVTAEDHWLPPDNFQEDPKGAIAHRTSPTNEGLFWVSTLAAFDFGYLGHCELAMWLERNLDSWEQLEHYQGHPYNWYDTQTLATLAPAYVSTVDSGNLAACALTVRQGLFETLKRPVLGTRAIHGLIDLLVLIDHAIGAVDVLHEHRTWQRTVQRVLRQFLAGDHVRLQTPRYWHAILTELARSVEQVAQIPPSWGENDYVDDAAALLFRIDAAQLHAHALQADFDALFPWVEQLLAGIPTRLVSNFASAPTDPQARHHQAWESLRHLLDAEHTLVSLAQLPERVAPLLNELSHALLLSPSAVADLALSQQWIESLRKHFADGAEAAERLIARYEQLAERLGVIAQQMDFTFLMDQQRKLFAIGYNHSTGQLDRSRYDLLASEARLASIIAIGKGDADYRHWLHLGRPLTRMAGTTGLLSWGGTMFEYLMPNLFLRNYPDTLLAQSCEGAVDRQIEFGQQEHVPWGISESAFAAFDNALTYQYRSFGVPGLGLKRGLAADLVVAPYATGLALAVRPRESLLNFRALAAKGGQGNWGFFESIDFTANRMADDDRAVVRCYFAHHQGMLLTSIANCLLDQCMQRRFHAEPRTRATEWLLQERIPVAATLIEPHGDEGVQAPVVREADSSTSRWLTTPHTSSPRTQLLSNGKYTVMVTNAGSGYSQCEEIRLTRWRADTTCDSWGHFIYLRDRRRDMLWSAGYQPTCKEPDEYEVLFSVDKAEIRRRDDQLETHCELCVCPDTNVEVRLITLTDHSERRRQIDVTSYAEVVLCPGDADLAHPAFQKLFVETEFIPERNALLCHRRPRSPDERPCWMVHVLATENALPDRVVGTTRFESSRERFLGRGGTAAAPSACKSNVELSGTTGPVLDPIVSLRSTVNVPPGQMAQLAFSTAFAGSRDEALAIADQYHDLRVVLRAFELAWAHSQVSLRHTHLTAGDIHLFQRLASLLLYPDAEKRAPSAVILANRQSQPGLWRYGVSGDMPIVVVKISQGNQEALIRELLLAHEYWRSRNFAVEMILLNEHPAGYVDAVQEQLNRLVNETNSWKYLGKRGGLFILQSARMPDEDRILLLAVASVVLDAGAGSLERQLEQSPRRRELPALLPRFKPRAAVEPVDRAANVAPASAGQFNNSLGHFDAKSGEYVIRLERGQWTPAPWSNVIANSGFGCLVTEAGLGCTWATNSRENRLTTWSNDPTGDPPAEAIYLRDDATGELWSPTPLPIREAEPYTVRHGQGYSRFEHRSHEIDQNLLVTIAPDDPVKLLQLQLKNTGSRRRQLSVTLYVDWVLGAHRQQTQLHIITEHEPTTGAMLVTNSFNHEFKNRVAFLKAVGQPATMTGDRKEFFGRNGAWQKPAALGRVELSGRTGTGYDPGGAVQVKLTLDAGQQLDVVFILGQAESRAQAEALISKYSTVPAVVGAADEIRQRWNDMLGVVQVKTPNSAFDLLVNRWLLYQTLACRYWGRTAFYQSGGAFGFRDQLQDVMALVYSRPDVAREHLIYAASRQFEEGDVQHWWHPPLGRGVRTRFSDDYLWLPFVAAHYIGVTGDRQVLEVVISFLHAPPLEAHEDERYDLPEISAQQGTLYEHCLRSIEHALRFGRHGLPLMGSGDWNDGMNRVGAGGQGESVWVGWFLSAVLDQFAPWVESMGDPARAARYRLLANDLRQAIESSAWDGAWFRRAYFDDGTPLGSSQNDACQIDSLTQSWSVIAGGDPARARQAMQSAWERLVRRGDQLALLFWPPFDKTALEPGYIKGYLPGIRENGGQYTHAALWMIQAFSLLGEGDRAMQLFDLIAPPNHASTREQVDRYKVEPYVVAADLYSLPPHTGRGGWTWYTGSAAWAYRVALEDQLGFRVRAGKLRIQPCIPASWTGYEITYRHRRAVYHIVVENPDHVQTGVRELYVDHAREEGLEITLVEEGDHEVRLVMGTAEAKESGGRQIPVDAR